MPTIVFISSKGGVGKTTSALVLALGLAGSGERVALVDADPTLPLFRWGGQPCKPAGVMVFPAPSLVELRDVLPVAQSWADWVIVDTEGSPAARQLIPAIAPDLALIPVGASPLEAHEAIKTSQALQAMSRTWDLPIPHACVFTRLPAAIRTGSMAEAVQQLRAADIRMLETPLVEKEVFRRLFSTGGDLKSLLPSDAFGLDAARTNAEHYVASVLKLLESDWSAPVAPLIARPVAVPARF
jgi:chromosome partitioning protein